MADSERDKEMSRILSSAVEQSSEGIAVTDPDGNLIFVNKAFAVMHGYSQDELNGKHLSIFHTPEQMPSVESANRQLREKGEFKGEVLHARRDGTPFPTLMHNTVLCDEKGKAIGMIGTLRDISERKKALEALRKSEERFKQVAENAGEWIWEVDAEGLYTYASPAVKQILGYTPEEIVGKKHFFDVFHPEEGERLKSQTFGVFAGKKPFRSFINRNIHKDGDEIWLSTSGVPVFDREGRFTGYRGVDIDITELKRAEDALAESEERFRTVVDFTYDWEYWIGPEGTYLYVSPSCERITGYRADEFMKDSGLLQKIVHTEDHGIFRQHLSDYCGAPDGKKEAGKVEFRIRTRDGEERWIGHVCQPVRGADGGWKGRRISNRDITEIKRAEEALRDSEGIARALLNAPYVAVLLLDQEGIILDVNSTTEERLSKTRDELIGLCAWDLTWPEVRAQRKTQFEQVIKTGKPARFEDCREGMWNDNVYYPVLDAEGRVTKAAIIARDITELKRLEEELRKHQCELEEMVEKRTAELEGINLELLMEINERRRIEKDLKDSEGHLLESKRVLEEKNIALREILEQLSVEKKKFKDDVVTNIDNLVLPILRKLDNEEGRSKHDYLELLKRNLDELATSFGRKLGDPRLKLTPREIEICDMIKTGLSTKEIAGLLRLSKKTVDKHRDNIRRKLGIIKRGINLSTFLQTL